MKIGLIAPPWAGVPSGSADEVETVVDTLARALVALGNEVRLFTVGDSTCPVPKEYLFAHAVEGPHDPAAEAAHVLAAHEALAGMDVIHDHTTLGPLVAHRHDAALPVVATVHVPFTPVTRSVYAAAARHALVVAVSRDQARRSEGAVPIRAVVHDGVDLTTFRPGDGGGGYLVFAGPLLPDSGADRAVRIAHTAGYPLRIVSRLHDRSEREWFATAVRPLLGSEDSGPENLSQAELAEVLGRADGLLHPATAPEPFGLVMPEALATGTPVVAGPTGAAPEIVTHGRTGYLCKSEASAHAAVRALDLVDRSLCRAAAERRFSSTRMAAEYLGIYSSALAGGEPTRRVPAQAQGAQLVP